MFFVIKNKKKIFNVFFFSFHKWKLIKLYKFYKIEQPVHFV